jgi:3'-phosphoadenosine 5'-phosphosulfate sulfotransferase (PAPS reductase)/FAD synthetase
MSGAVVTWASFVAMWKMHAATKAYARTYERSIELVIAATTGRKLAGCLSGGKDSTVLGKIIRDVELRNHVEIQCVHAHMDLNCPGQREAVEALAEELQLDVDIIEPTVDLWKFLVGVPKEKHILNSDAMRQFYDQFTAPHLLVDYQYNHNFDGAITGMRGTNPKDGGESRGRMMNARMRGPLYQIELDKLWMSNPLAGWTARDVWACITQNKLPIHNYYQRLYERFGIPPESPGSRVGELLVMDVVANRGALEHTRALYPELWHKLLAIRPELGWR